MVIGNDVCGQLGVGIYQRIERIDDLLLDQAAHLQDLGAHGFELGIVLFVSVFELHRAILFRINSAAQARRRYRLPSYCDNMITASFTPSGQGW